MKKVIMIGEEPKEESKDVEFTHYLSTGEGFREDNDKPSNYEKIVYLGRCDEDGDMFAAYDRGSIYIYKGNLNNGTY